jgi:hypothetical protein
MESFGRIGVLIRNAGILLYKNLWKCLRKNVRRQ